MKFSATELFYLFIFKLKRSKNEVKNDRQDTNTRNTLNTKNELESTCDVENRVRDTIMKFINFC